MRLLLPDVVAGLFMRTVTGSKLGELSKFLRSVTETANAFKLHVFTVTRKDPCWMLFVAPVFSD